MGHVQLCENIIVMTTPYSRAPHQGVVGAVGASAPNAALLIDFDNVTMGMRSDLSKDLKKLLQSDIIKGKVTVQRAYADWRRYPQYIVPLSEASIDLIFAPAYGSSKKNATDIRMAIDGMELVFTRPEIGTFILLTGDSDFSSLVLKLKEYGKYVIGVGIQESSSDILVQNCDEYYSYTSLTGLRKTTDGERTTADPWALVEKAVNRMAERDDVMRSDRLKQVMIELDAGFNEGDFGFSKFSRFLSEAAAKGLVQLKRLENGQYEVGPTGSGRAEGRRPRRDEPREEGRTRGRGGRGSRSRGGNGDGARAEQAGSQPAAPRAIEVASVDSEGAEQVTEAEHVQAEAVLQGAVEPPRTEGGESKADPLRSAYDLLRRALEAMKAQGRGSIRDSDVKRKMLEFDSAFDETELGFGKFSRFLRQAHDHEVVTLHKQEGGNYEVSLGATPGAERDAGASVEKATAEPSTAPSSERVVMVEPGLPTGLGPRRGSTRRRQDEGALQLFNDAPARPGTPATAPHVPVVAAASLKLDPDGLGLPTEPEAQIRYLTNSYRGVGRKTAEALVEAFGVDLYSVLQSEPDRVAAVVSGNRAEQLLEGWRLDYERRTGRAVSGGDEGGAELPAGADSSEAEADAPAPAGSRRRTRRGGRRSGRDRTG